MEDNNYYRKIEGMLYNYPSVKAEIKNIELDIEVLENDFDKDYNTITGSDYSEKSSATYKISSNVENKIVSRESKSEISNLQRKKRKLEIQVERIDNMLSILTEKEKLIIELRYFKRLAFEDMGDIVERNGTYLMSKRKEIIETKLIPLIKR